MTKRRVLKCGQNLSVREKRMKLIYFYIFVSVKLKYEVQNYPKSVELYENVVVFLQDNFLLQEIIF